MRGLQDKRAIVTGAGGAIGRAIFLRLAGDHPPEFRKFVK